MPKGAVHPSRLATPLDEFRLHPGELDAAHIAPFVPRFAEVDQDVDHRLETIARLMCEITSVHGAATALMQLEPWDFMAVYYDGIDHFCHAFMRSHPPRPPWVDERDFDLYNGVIEAAYRYHDMMLGTLLALAGPETTVILMSDHGFHPVSRLMARVGARVSAHVLVLAPSSQTKAWVESTLWTAATSIPGVIVRADPGGSEAIHFGGATSGEVLLYSAEGRLQFSGGITAARGHEGDNAGRTALQAMLLGSAGGAGTTPVYGCGLFAPAQAARSMEASDDSRP